MRLSDVIVASERLAEGFAAHGAIEDIVRHVFGSIWFGRFLIEYSLIIIINYERECSYQSLGPAPPPSTLLGRWRQCLVLHLHHHQRQLHFLKILN